MAHYDIRKDVEHVEFYDLNMGRTMILVDDEEETWGGWLMWLHPDGQWVSLRMATDEDRERITKAKAKAKQVRLRGGWWCDA